MAQSGVNMSALMPYAERAAKILLDNEQKGSILEAAGGFFVARKDCGNINGDIIAEFEFHGMTFIIFEKDV